MKAMLGKYEFNCGSQVVQFVNNEKYIRKWEDVSQKEKEEVIEKREKTGLGAAGWKIIE